MTVNSLTRIRLHQIDSNSGIRQGEDQPPCNCTISANNFEVIINPFGMVVIFILKVILVGEPNEHAKAAHFTE